MLHQQGAFEMGELGHPFAAQLDKVSWLTAPSGIKNGTESRIQVGYWLAQKEKGSKNFKL